MRRPSWKAESIRRKKNRERMRKVRLRRKKKRKCRQCERPVVISERTGRPAATCKVHLLADRARKTPIELRFDQEPATWLEIPLPWLEDEPIEVAKWAQRTLYKLRWLDE